VRREKGTKVRARGQEGGGGRERKKERTRKEGMHFLVVSGEGGHYMSDLNMNDIPFVIGLLGIKGVCLSLTTSFFFPSFLFTLPPVQLQQTIDPIQLVNATSLSFLSLPLHNYHPLTVELLFLPIFILPSQSTLTLAIPSAIHSHTDLFLLLSRSSQLAIGRPIDAPLGCNTSNTNKQKGTLIAFREH
jgi:hypothetical protein